MTKERENIQKFMTSLREMHKVMDQVFRAIAVDMGHTPLQLFVLRQIAQAPEQSLKDLAEELKVSNSTMSGVVERLVQANLIKRERSTKDRRVLVMELTEEGQTTSNDFRQRFFAKLEGIKRLPEEDMQRLLALHQNIIARIKRDQATTTEER
ncbi:MarR family transcriptional regulator [Bacillaceae bacterium SIJ1]|uniref:MarR family winged helix-turn-helix transcriptional regulator n=1 Tax=Litoribacterium kuwaitense TaxID=1398745 RepID=UPI0013E9C11A|nr:MarR family transcriptional regulator [Litoribacterium kuwaitense]NGP45385.1 MarR family transcriptional regulator [Litoribacterium kuwaitense]